MSALLSAADLFAFVGDSVTDDGLVSTTSFVGAPTDSVAPFKVSSSEFVSKSGETSSRFC